MLTKQAVRFFEAKDADGLKEALKSVVEKVVQAPSGFNLLPKVEGTAEIIPSGVTWELYAKLSDEKAAATAKGGAFSKEIGPGTYLVTAKYEDAYLEANVLVKEAATTTQDFVFKKKMTGPGKFTPRLTLKEGMAPLEGVYINWLVLSPELDPISGQRKKFGSWGASSNPAFELEAGDYLVTATVNNASAQLNVTLKPGEERSDVLNLNAGILESEMILKEGGDPIREYREWGVFAAEPDAEGNFARFVRWSASGGSPFALCTGR